MNHGEEEQVIQTQPKGGLRRQAPTPQFIKEKPSLDRSLHWYWDSFLHLDTERLKDYGPIPWSAINNYRKEWGITTPASFDSFLTIMRGIDRAYLEEQSKKLDKGRKT